MRETITTELLRRLQQAPPTAVLDIYDTKVRRLVPTVPMEFLVGTGHSIHMSSPSLARRLTNAAGRVPTQDSRID